MKLAMGMLSLLAITMAMGVDGQLFKNLKKFDPSKVAVPLVKKSPEELVKVVKEKAEAVVPKDFEEGIQGALNASSAEELKHSTMEKIGGAFQDMAGQSNVSGRVHSTRPQQQQLAEVLARAGAALQTGADAIVNATSSDIEGSLMDASAKAFNTSNFAGVKDAVQQASPQDVASELRKVTPQAANVLNQTSQNLAEKLKQASPKAVGFLNRTGNKVADALAPKRIPEDPADGEPDDYGFGQHGGVGISMVLLLVLAVVAGYLVSVRFKTSQRTPVLLSDALDTTRPGSTRDDRTVQMTTQEPFFSKF